MTPLSKRWNLKNRDYGKYKSVEISCNCEKLIHIEESDDIKEMESRLQSLITNTIIYRGHQQKDFSTVPDLIPPDLAAELILNKFKSKEEQVRKDKRERAIKLIEELQQRIKENYGKEGIAPMDIDMIFQSEIDGIKKQIINQSKT